MKKFFRCLAIVTVSCMALLTSCQKSNADLIKEYEKLCNELVEATTAGNLGKIATLSEKGSKLEKELAERNLSDEEKAQVLEIQANAATGMASGAVNGVGNMMESAAGAAKKISGSFKELENLMNDNSDED